MSTLSYSAIISERSLSGRKPSNEPGVRTKFQVERPVVLVRDETDAVRHLADHPGMLGDGPDRAVGLRQIDVPAPPQPHERPDRRHAAHGRGAAGRRRHLRPRRQPRGSAAARGHGVSEVEPVPQEHLRERGVRAARGRRDATSRPLQAICERCLRGAALVGRGQGPAGRLGPEPVRRAGAAAVHRPRPGDRPGSAASGRAGLGPGPGLARRASKT